MRIVHFLQNQGKEYSWILREKKKLELDIWISWRLSMCIFVHVCINLSLFYSLFVGFVFHFHIYLISLQSKIPGQEKLQFFFCFCGFFFFCSTRPWTQGLHLEPLHQPYFVMGFFRDRVSWTICPSWFWTMILLISASWVARITGMSHWYPASFVFWTSSHQRQIYHKIHFS
jgi:hypothetical protein